MHFNKLKKGLFKSILLSFLTINLFSQSINNLNSSIKGKLLDAKKVGVIAATVNLIIQDSVITAFTITNGKGEFNFDNVKPNNYTLKIQHLEFETFVTSSYLLKAGENKTLAPIVLKSSSQTLDEVVIKQKKAQIEVKADKIIFNVDASPSASGTNGLDLLRKAPGVRLDMDNNISLLGKDGVQIFVNGIQSKLSGTDLTNFLQSMTSDNIASLEIISNPSSKYDAEGSGGIINFRTKKNVATGFNGNVTSSFTKGVYYKYSNNLSVNYGAEKLKANLEITQSQDTNLEIFDDNKVIGSTILDLYSRESQGRKGYNIALGLETQLTENQILNFNFRIIPNQLDNLLNSNTDIFENNSSQLTKILSSRSYLKGDSNNYIFNLNHIWNCSKTSNISTNISLGSYNTERNTFQPNTYFKPDGKTIINEQNDSFDANTNINLWSANVDFEKEWKSLSFSTGIKYAHVFTKNIFNFFNIKNNTAVNNPTKSNDFNYDENVAAAYTNIKIKLSNFFDLNAGVRVENTDSRGLLISSTTVNDKDVPRNYTDIFPNISLNYDTQKYNSFNLSFGKRITRPKYQDLNPFESPNSQLVFRKGNPFLKPNYITNYQFTYAYKQKLIISNTYSVTKDFFANIFEDLGGGATQLIPRNMQETTNYGLSISYPQTINKYWEIMTLVNGYYRTYYGNLEGTVIDINTKIWNFNIQNNLKLPKGFLMDISYYKQGSWVWRGTVLIEGTHELGFGIRKDFLDKNLQIRITGSDILRTTSDYPYTGNYGGMLIKGTYTNDERRFGLGVTWKFGNQKVKKLNKTDGLNEELKRL